MSSYYDIPFGYRALLLIAVLGALSLVDLAFRGRSATRWHEYLFLLACAGIGALAGAAIDLVTSSISPEYFIYAKGIEPGDGFTQRALLLGSEAGFVAGAVAAGCLLVANTSSPSRRGRKPQLSYRRLARWTLLPLVLALITGSIVGVTFSLGDGESILPWIEPGVPLRAPGTYLITWGVHAGVYLGLLLGVVAGAVKVRRIRRRLAAA